MIDWVCMLVFNPLTMMIVITVSLIHINNEG